MTQPTTHPMSQTSSGPQAHLHAVAANPPLAKGGLTAFKLRRVADHMCSRLGDRVALRDLTALTGLSPSHFCHAFKRSTGVTPRAWLRLRRIEHAVELLRQSELSLSDIALACGFADQAHFSRSFSHQIGQPPGAWRRAHALKGRAR